MYVLYFPPDKMSMLFEWFMWSFVCIKQWCMWFEHCLWNQRCKLLVKTLQAAFVSFLLLHILYISIPIALKFKNHIEEEVEEVSFLLILGSKLLQIAILYIFKLLPEANYSMLNNDQHKVLLLNYRDSVSILRILCDSLSWSTYLRFITVIMI